MLVNNAYCLDIDKVKIYFLNGDYKSAISEGEKALMQSDANTKDLDELYYILGLSYMKDGNYLRASDIFEIILREFKESQLKDEAKLGLGDSYFLKGDYDKAELSYSGLIESSPRTKFKALLYYRLSEVEFKKGNTQQAKEYLAKLKEYSPSSLEMNLDKDLFGSADIYYTVQVGSFVNHVNARNLQDRLISKGFDAYFEEIDTDGAKTYRVRVGKLKSRQDATQLENRLLSEGYPTKIIP